MKAITSSFVNVVCVLVAVSLAGGLLAYFIFKRRPGFSDIDEAFWKLRFLTIVFGALIYIGIVYLPSTGFYREVDLSPGARETAFQNLAHNQQRIGEQLDQMKGVLTLIFLFLIFYITATSSFVGRLKKERDRLVSAESPELKKPLGLDTD
jgi:hypothetical protein